MTGSTTNYSLPFPEGIDRVAVHSDIESLAQAVDGRLLEVFQSLLDQSSAALSAEDDLDTIDNGIYSVWNGDIAEALGLPNNALGVLLSIRYGTGAGAQLWIPRLYGEHELWVRSELSSGWSDWGQPNLGSTSGGTGGGTTTSGFKTVPLALTRGDGGGSTAEASASVRYRIQYNAEITRWRLHVVDGNPRFNLRRPTGIALRSIYWMPHNDVGTPIDRVTLTAEGPDKADGDREDLVTEWFDQPIGGNVPGYISIAYQTTQDPISLVGGCYVNTDWNANGSTSMGGFDRRTAAPFDIWIEAETPAGTPVVASLGDSNSVGVGTYLPVHESYLSMYCRRIGALPVHYGHSGDSLQHWEDPDQEKWNRWRDLAPVDAVLQMMGSNDMGAGNLTLGEMQRRFQVVTDIAARKISPIVHVGLLKPRNNPAGNYQQVRQEYNAWLSTMPAPAREVHDLSSPVANAADTAILPQYNADGTHMNTAGHLLLARSIHDPITRRVDQEEWTTFAWTGIPDASQSVKREGGREVARNLYLDPKLTDPSTWATADTVEAMTWDSSWTGNANPSGFALSGEPGSIHAGSSSLHRATVSPGDVITFGINLATAEGFELRARIYWYNSAGDFLAATDAPNQPSSGEKVFTRVVVTGTAPADAATASPYVWLYEGSVNPTVPATGYLDGITVERGETDGAYFDGDTEGWDRLDRLEQLVRQLHDLT